MPSTYHRDPFVPALLTEQSESFEVSLEQQSYIKDILDKSSSDSRFAEKAFLAIMSVLTAGRIKYPKLTSLAPNTAKIGDPTFTLRVLGENFDQGSTIQFAGLDEPTTFVSAGEVTTGVNMDVWHGADTLPVHVRNPNGVISDPLMFTFTDPVTRSEEKKSDELKNKITDVLHKESERYSDLVNKLPPATIKDDSLLKPHVEPHLKTEPKAK